MFIEVTQRRNPALIDAAVRLHQQGTIPSNCYIVDLDTVAANARLVAEAGAQAGLTLFQMTKQWGRNPLVALAVAQAGIPKAVAVDFDEARVLHRAGVQIGHLGHLVQVPRGEAGHAIDMRPDQVTVQNYGQAANLSRAAVAAGVVQPILLRVEGPDDVYYPAQRGGVSEAALEETAMAISALPGVRVVGVTTFPCLLWNPDTAALEPTPNLETLQRSAQRLRQLGIDATVVNAPSATCIATLPTLAAAGATQAEPGSCLLGQTPLHAVSDEPERPAMVYVTEVTHVQGTLANTLGGGFYARSRARTALVYGDSDEPVATRVQPLPADAIDYHGTVETDGPVAVGNTAVYAFRSQVFVSRASVAVLRDVQGTPQVVGLFNRDGFAVDETLRPLGPEQASQSPSVSPQAPVFDANLLEDGGRTQYGGARAQG
jgi:predicted amino acid racemase